MASRKPLVIVSGAVSELPTGDDLAGYVKVGPSFSAYMGAAQYPTSGVFTKLNFDTERFDTHNCYDTTNKRFTAPYPGKLVVSVIVDYFDTVSATIVIASVFINGAEGRRLVDFRSPILPSGVAYMFGAATGTDTFHLSAGDYIEVYGYISAATPKFLGVNTWRTSFSGVFIGN